jgi:hypothetical protein
MYCFDFPKIFSEYGTQSQQHYEKNPSSHGGISHMQCISGLGSQDSGYSPEFHIPASDD